MRAVPTIALAGAAVLGVAYVSGIRINHSPSMPVGIWLETSAASVTRAGDVVVVCPTAH